MTSRLVDWTRPKPWDDSSPMVDPERQASCEKHRVRNMIGNHEQTKSRGMVTPCDELRQRGAQVLGQKCLENAHEMALECQVSTPHLPLTLASWWDFLGASEMPWCAVIEQVNVQFLLERKLGDGSGLASPILRCCRKAEVGPLIFFKPCGILHPTSIGLPLGSRDYAL
ncbi:hypothetical protein GOBAR_DD22495 [Gossypium barbadense]|nr:hypothetical protein GOBAR_DD22495 [Gossypium barbadense]